MGCLDVSVSRISSGFGMCTSRVGSPLLLRVLRSGESMVVSCSMLCAVNTQESYLRVNPDVVWLTPEQLSKNFDIYSNVWWEII